jgi:hypothetical protein
MPYALGLKYDEPCVTQEKKKKNFSQPRLMSKDLCAA